jgi:hypothetical protein
VRGIDAHGFLVGKEVVVGEADRWIRWVRVEDSVDVE